MSKSKAQDLKNSYVNGIIDGMRTGEQKVTNELAGKLGSEKAQLASTVYDAATGKVIYQNDNDPRSLYFDSARGLKREFYDPEHANPIQDHLIDRHKGAPGVFFAPFGWGVPETNNIHSEMMMGRAMREETKRMMFDDPLDRRFVERMDSSDYQMLAPRGGSRPVHLNKRTIDAITGNYNEMNGF